MNKSALLVTLASLAFSPTLAQQTALDSWAETYLPRLRQEGRSLLQGRFDITELYEFAQLVVAAAQQLKGVFSGQERAKIAQALLHTAVKECAPLTFQEWALPLVDGPGCAALIESAFQRVFGSGQQDVSAAPVVDASDVDKGGVQ